MATNTPARPTLDEQQVKDMASAIYDSKDRVRQYALIQVLVSEATVKAVEALVAELDSAASFKAMQAATHIKKDAESKDLVKLHGLLEQVSQLLVSVTHEHKNRAGRGKSVSVEHKVEKIATPSGVVGVIVKTRTYDED